MADNLKKNVYKGYSNRYGSLIIEEKPSSDEKNPTEALSDDISKKQLELLSIYPFLPLIVNTLEDALVVVNPDTGLETDDSVLRRTVLLNKLTRVFNDYNKLIKSARRFYPDFYVDFEQKLGNTYKDIVSDVRKICGDINETRVVYNETNINVRSLVDKTVSGVETPVDVSDNKLDRISSRYNYGYKSSVEMKDLISRDTDTPEYIKLLPEIPKYISEEIKRFQNNASKEPIKPEVQTSDAENKDGEEQTFFTYQEILDQLKTINDIAVKSQKTAESYAKYFIKETEHVQNEIPDEKPEVDTQEAPVYFREDEDEYEEK